MEPSGLYVANHAFLVMYGKPYWSAMRYKPKLTNSSNLKYCLVDDMG